MGTLRRSCAKVREPSELRFGVVRGVARVIDVLDGGPRCATGMRGLGLFSDYRAAPVKTARQVEKARRVAVCRRLSDGLTAELQRSRSLQQCTKAAMVVGNSYPVRTRCVPAPLHCCEQLRITVSRVHTFASVFYSSKRLDYVGTPEGRPTRWPLPPPP